MLGLGGLGGLGACASTPEPSEPPAAENQTQPSVNDQAKSQAKVAVIAKPISIDPSPDNFAALLYVTRRAMFVDAVAKECAESAMIAEVTMERWRYRNAHLLGVGNRYHHYIQQHLAAHNPKMLVQYKKEHVTGALDLLSIAKQTARAKLGDDADDGQVCLNTLKRINVGEHDFNNTRFIIRLNQIDGAMKQQAAEVPASASGDAADKTSTDKTSTAAPSADAATTTPATTTKPVP